MTYDEFHRGHSSNQYIYIYIYTMDINILSAVILDDTTQALNNTTF